MNILIPLLLPLLILVDADSTRHESGFLGHDAVNPGFTTESIIPAPESIIPIPESSSIPECTLDDSAGFFKDGSSNKDSLNKQIVVFFYQIVMYQGSSEDIDLVLGRVESKVMKLVLPSLFDACPTLLSLPGNRKKRILIDSNSLLTNLAGLSSSPKDVKSDEGCKPNEDSDDKCTLIKGGFTIHTDLDDLKSVAILQSQIEKQIKESLDNSGSTWTDVSKDIVSVSWVDEDYEVDNIVKIKSLESGETLKTKSNSSILAATLVPVGVAAIALFAFLKQRSKSQSSLDMTNREIGSLGSDDEDAFEVDSWKAHSFDNNFKSGVVQFEMDESGNIESNLQKV